ncbi:glutamate N-acetyltransferase / amino-acid N-acetyltransferase [Salinibacillus kushneri]|uniref:Arginine biosynthesis bifunctional protein ArgJ n=1 Tax=Salinibacillus kushneri TaxID=237682 RepID=A0A1H9Z2F6_9BACI|nr:bifunctional ornithine acetyltransferase/N-acetylglutamate synthase [Salinibacillus kushneri]SES75632.1 glutamate N-acetyltransferase / amino-acid N-acetyltransferase [Salinibacillus kushneri]
MSTFYEVAEKLEHLHVLETGSVTTPKGYTAGGLHCGIRFKQKDLGWVYSEVPAEAAGVYTTNLIKGAPLHVTQDSIAQEGKLQGIIVNSGKANTCTGEQGIQDAYEMRKNFTDMLNIKEHYGAVVSTGVIGELLPMEKVNSGISQIPAAIKKNEPNHFEKAILTTDTFTKNVAVQMNIGGKTISIGGAAKGSGMIHPNMATMLSFITTDANVPHSDLHAALKEVTDETFNCISVDGDTSTNDMVLLLANGLAQNDLLTKDHLEWQTFVEGLRFVCESLAKQIARDGEGATKLIEVQVSGLEDDHVARQIAKSIISSNLVKTAIHGEDPNWGRIVCSVGYSGTPLNPDDLTVSIGPVKVVENGLPLPYDEGKATQELKEEHVTLFVDFNQGVGRGNAWGCDLSYEYVRINASYRT